MISIEAYEFYEALEDAELAKEAQAAYEEYLKDPSKAKNIEEYLAERDWRDAAE